MLQGQRDLLTVSPADPLRAGAAGRGAARRLLHDGQRRRDAGAEAARAATPTTSASTLANRVQAGRGPGRAVRAREGADPARPTCRDDYIQISSGLGEAPPLNIVVLPVLFEGEVKAVHRAGLVRRASTRSTSPSSTSSPRASASCSTRSRPTCGPRSCSSSRRRWPRSCRRQQEELTETNKRLEQQAALAAGIRGTAQAAAGRAAADQRGAGGEGAAAGRAERGGRAQEPRGRAGQAGAGGEGRAARAHLQVQVASSWPTCRTSCARRSTAC